PAMESLLLTWHTETTTMMDVLVTIRTESGETEEYTIDYLPTLEAAYAASFASAGPGDNRTHAGFGSEPSSRRRTGLRADRRQGSRPALRRTRTTGERAASR